MKDNYPLQTPSPSYANVGYQNAQQGLAAAGQQSASRFCVAAGRLQGQVATYAGFVDRLSRVADRLSGAVPEAVSNAQTKQSGNSVAAMLDGAQDDFDAVTVRLNGILERLEAL
jgi:hypothetical protein